MADPAFDEVLGGRSSRATNGHQRKVFDRVHAELGARDRVGWATYARPMLSGDGRDTLRDALEEALDLVVYLTKLIMEREDAAKEAP